MRIAISSNAANDRSRATNDNDVFGGCGRYRVFLDPPLTSSVQGFKWGLSTSETPTLSVCREANLVSGSVPTAAQPGPKPFSPPSPISGGKAWRACRVIAIADRVAEPTLSIRPVGDRAAGPKMGMVQCLFPA
jgi:hypothetical protein